MRNYWWTWRLLRHQAVHWATKGHDPCEAPQAGGPGLPVRLHEAPAVPDQVLHPPPHGEALIVECARNNDIQARIVKNLNVDVQSFIYFRSLTL